MSNYKIRWNNETGKIVVRRFDRDGELSARYSSTTYSPREAVWTLVFGAIVAEPVVRFTYLIARSIQSYIP